MRTEYQEKNTPSQKHAVSNPGSAEQTKFTVTKLVVVPVAMTGTQGMKNSACAEQKHVAKAARSFIYPLSSIVPPPSLPAYSGPCVDKAGVAPSQCPSPSSSYYTIASSIHSAPQKKTRPRARSLHAL
jgi:hypothetical protein